MNTHVSVLSKNGPINDALIEQVKARAARCLSFRGMPHETKVWLSQNRRIAVLAWCNEPTHPQHAELIHSEGDAALTISGYVYDADVRSIGDLNTRLMRASDTRTAIAELPGVFAIAHADGARMKVRAWNGIIPTEPLYWYEGDALAVVGTRAVLVHLIGLNIDEPDYDMMKFGPFLSCGYFSKDLTPFRGVRKLEPNTEITLTEAGTVLAPVDDAAWAIGEAAVQPTDAFWDEMTQTMLDSIKAIGSFREPVKLHLSGGKDSRLLAAALSTAGVQFTVRTGGLADHPDAIGARRVAEILKLDHTVETPAERKDSVMKADILHKTSEWLLLTEGMINAWGGVPASPVFLQNQQLIGQGGEYFRGGWLKHPDNRSDLDYEKCWNIFEKKLYPNSPYIKREVMVEYMQFIHGLLPDPPGADLQGRMERAFAYTYGWGWAPAQYVGSAVQNHRYYPYCNSRLLRKNYSLPWIERLREEPHYNMMVRLCPELTLIPFTKFRWGFEADGPVPGRNPETWSQREPIVAPVLSDVRVNWKKDIGVGTLRDEFYGQVFENPRAERLFEALDRDRLKAMFTSRTIFTSHITRFMWNVYAASTLISNDWLAPELPSRIVPFKVTHQWFQPHRRLLVGLESSRKAATNYVTRQLSVWAKKSGGKLSKSNPDKIASDARTRKDLGKISRHAAEIYVERLTRRVGDAQKQFQIPDDTWGERIGSLKAARTTGGGTMTLKTLMAEGKKGLSQIGIEQMLDLTELAGTISQGESRSAVPRARDGRRS